MQKIKKGDEVIVISGKDKGRRGTVVRMMPYQRVLVEGINIAKKHQRPDPARGIGGGIVDQEAPIHISNVMLYNPVTKKGDRVGVKSLEDGRRVRFFKSNGEVVDA